MKEFLASAAAKVAVVALILLVIAGALVARSCSEARTATASTKLANSQAGAAAASGADAVNTVGNRMDADAATDTITRENADAIHHAEGAAAPVAAPVRDAGLASLCRRAAYLRDPKCLQYAHP